MGTSSEEKVNSVGEVDLGENEEEKAIEQICEVPTSEIVEKEAPLLMGHPEIDPDLVKSPPIVDTEPIEIATETQYKLQSEIATETQYKLQSLVELVMWRDTSKTSFVFGLGTFVVLSSSYAKDLNFSLISTSSYLGLLYLAMAFIYRSIQCRGAVDYGDTDQKQVLGEEEAIWAVKLVLPYLNELLIKFKSLFSGDPATTMKLALVLFVLARCGGSITVWTLVRFAFFGVFTIPKVCASYSAQLSGYGKFWMDRFRDAWDSCTHKKAVAAAIFTLIWNLSSTVARVWAVFFLAVAMRYYQQCLVEEWAEYEPPQQQTEGPHQQPQKSDDSKQGPSKAQIHISNRFGPTLPDRPRRRGVGPTLGELRKEKKGT
ncbi:Reticulon-like protein B21 [Acorus calamus]|uniref:Reticulon-like protein n=1 Tax=Acorus calamus TaxID=4465 RepID=A0AAV9FAS0_ACOCL|nr:Reticulon-like protein B21 [Acorus calamus]